MSNEHGSPTLPQNKGPSPEPNSNAPHKDDTFRNYTSSSAQAYAQNRRGYPQAVIDLVVSLHTSSGGATDLLVDVGCGPGTATRSLAPHFTHAVGADPGTSMIETARGIPGATANGEAVVYEVCGAEGLRSLRALDRFGGGDGNENGDGDVSGHGNERRGGVGQGQEQRQAMTEGESRGEVVDLITAATAAHWFEYPQVYLEAARILKPGGSIIFWTTKSYYIDERSTPNAAKVQALFQSFENDVLRPHELAGNRLSRDMYRDLPLPWSRYEDATDESEKLLALFDQDAFQRLEFNVDGKVRPGEAFLLARRLTFDECRRGLGTASPVARWREANADKVASGEVEDCVDRLVRQTRELFDEVPEGRGRDWIEAGAALVVLVIKKKTV